MADEAHMTDQLDRVLEKIDAQGEQIKQIASDVTAINLSLAKRESQGAQISSIRTTVETHDRMIVQHRTVGQVLMGLGVISLTAAFAALVQALSP